MTDKTTPIKRKSVDYGRIEAGWRAGLLSPRQLAAIYTQETGDPVSHAAIIKRAKRDGWTRNVVIHEKSTILLEKDELIHRAGFIYIIYFDDSANQRYYKIGMSQTFHARFADHQCSSPFKIYVACAYFVGNMRQEERALHLTFASKRVRGEWFSLDQQDLYDIAQRAVLI